MARLKRSNRNNNDNLEQRQIEKRPRLTQSSPPAAGSVNRPTTSVDPRLSSGTSGCVEATTAAAETGVRVNAESESSAGVGVNVSCQLPADNSGAEYSMAVDDVTILAMNNGNDG